VRCRGAGAHREVECRLAAALDEAARQPPVVSSAGALISGLHALGASRVALITPYMRPLADEVAAYVRSEGIEVSEVVALEVADNVEVGRLDPETLVPEARRVAA